MGRAEAGQAAGPATARPAAAEAGQAAELATARPATAEAGQAAGPEPGVEPSTAGAGLAVAAVAGLAQGSRLALAATGTSSALAP